MRLLAGRKKISIHAPHAGSDCLSALIHHLLQISIHAPHAGSDPNYPAPINYAYNISIHAPHAGSDGRTPRLIRVITISIHAPHAGSDTRAFVRICWSIFQSTLPMRGATAARRCRYHFFKISIHAPHAGSDTQILLCTLRHGISIHAPHAGSDGK